MKKFLKNKGFAVSTLLYGISIIMVIVIISTLSIMATNRKINDDINNTINEELNSNLDVPVMLSGNDFNKIFIDQNTNNMIYNFDNIIFEEKITTNYENYEYHFDLSEKQNGAIIGYIDNMTLKIQANGKISANENCNRLFNRFKSNINFNNVFNTSATTNMNYMFINYEGNLTNLTTIDTSNVTTMNGMFGSSKISNLNLSAFDTSNVTSMESMFHNSMIPSLDLSSFDTSKVTKMRQMFMACSAKELNFTGWDTYNVTDMSEMFSYFSMKELDLTDLYIGYGTYTNYMFYNSQEIKTVYVNSNEAKNVIDDLYYKPSTLTVIVK